MIKFENLMVACEELGFQFINYRTFKSVVDTTGSNWRLMNFSSDIPWAISFTDFFNVLERSEKAKLIKAITKDYEEFINGDE